MAWNGALLAAARKGDAERMRSLLEKKPNERIASLTDASSLTVLHIAAASGSEWCVSMLLAAGADKTARSEDGHRPLHLARNAKVARLLVPDGLDARTSALAAVALGDVAALRTLLARRRGAAEEGDELGYTALHLAALCGSVECVRTLLEAGGNKNARQVDGRTPLHLAVRGDHIECVGLLLRAGAEKNVSSQEGLTALHFAASGGHAQCVELLLRAGADKDAENEKCSPPLHVATRHGHASCVELLLRAGANKEAKIMGGLVPLHVAAQMGHLECVELLLRAGADKDASSKGGWRPIHAAARDGPEKVLELLLRAGADKDAKWGRDRTPLHLSIERLREGSAAMLLRAGADKEAKLESGATPLHLAAQVGSVRITELLLQAGADPTVRAAALKRFGRVIRDATPARIALQPNLSHMLLRAELRVQLTPLAAAAARGELFDSRLYDAALWRVVARFAGRHD